MFYLREKERVGDVSGQKEFFFLVAASPPGPHGRRDSRGEESQSGVSLWFDVIGSIESLSPVGEGPGGEEATRSIRSSESKRSAVS